MKKASLRRERMLIPTYEVGEEERLPMFFEKRIYQGSSGRVYPNPVIEKIFDEKKEKEYDAVILENEYLYVVVLPELGGRIYTAYDKSNHYDFVYHNRVIKPALVGLLGPWISGGIEFNWPQHHRPSTFKKINCKTSENGDGSVSVFVGETENMFGLEQVAQIRLYPDKAYIEISVQVYNRSDLDQTFLWWANPAYKVNDNTATIMPPDVTAVMDHGKRAVSTFPIATGEYYKMDYSAGVDISRYKNIPVPTSFMAYKSEFDFVGGYDFGKKAGLYHFADHHVSPGKKQWTWGCGDFGKAWDRNLTDEDGPYVELMTGCYTDNQPDFTFIRPGEEKTFTQYFMPYREVGYIKNANRDFCLNCEDGQLKIYSTGEFDHVRIRALSDGKTVYEGVHDFTPHTDFFRNVPERASVVIEYEGGRLCYDPAKVKRFDIPSPATAIPVPKEVKSLEELYLYGLHIEQYRHATRLPEDYYLEGLRRDPTDARLNCAYGTLLLRRGLFEESKRYFAASITKLTLKNPNPPTTEPYFGAAIAMLYLGDTEGAYDYFYKCIWSNENKSAAFYYLALIDLRRGDLYKAEAHARESINNNARNIKALNLLGRVLLCDNRKEEAKTCFVTAQKVDVLDVVSAFELSVLEGKEAALQATDYEITDAAKEYLFAGQECVARTLLEQYVKSVTKAGPSVFYYLAYACRDNLSVCEEYVALAKKNQSVIYFPNRIFDIIVLQALEKISPDSFIEYCLGNTFYDKKQYDLAAAYWRDSVQKNPSFPAAKRNLSLYYYNKKRDGKRALEFLESAYADEKTNSRLMMELFQLYVRLGKDKEFLYAFLQDNLKTAEWRDDLWLEYIALVNEKDPAEAEKLILARKFHPWEGGEGKVTKLYKKIKISLYMKLRKEGKVAEGMEKLREALVYPENLGEGKLILDGDNDIHYHLGEGYQLLGEPQLARREYSEATRGSCVIADELYYNDSPVEYVCYIAMAYAKLGDLEKTEKIRSDMLAYARKNRNLKRTSDYFAVSLPDLLIWEEDLDARNRRFCDKLETIANGL